MIKGQSRHGHLYVIGKEKGGTKNGLHRSIPMTKRAADIVWGRVAMAEKDTDKLFPYDNRRMLNLFDQVRTHLGFGEDAQFIPCTCRHTCRHALL